MYIYIYIYIYIYTYIYTTIKAFTSSRNQITGTGIFKKTHDHDIFVYKWLIANGWSNMAKIRQY